MDNQDQYIKELEERIATAVSMLHHLANEQRHRRHGCPYEEVVPEDLNEIEDVLLGKTIS